MTLEQLKQAKTLLNQGWKPSPKYGFNPGEISYIGVIPEWINPEGKTMTFKHAVDEIKNT